MTGPQPKFRLAQIFLQRAAFTYRREPVTLPPDTPHSPQTVNVSLGFQNLNDGEATQVMVGITTDPNDGDENALYDFAVEMVAIVHDVDRSAFSDQQLAEVVATIIFPFLREAVANLTGRGRFGPVWINPFNVRAALNSAFQGERGAGKLQE